MLLPCGVEQSKVQGPWILIYTTNDIANNHIFDVVWMNYSSTLLLLFFLFEALKDLIKDHGTIIRTRITCKIKSLVICATQLWGGFKVFLNISEFSRVWKNVESWLVYANKFSWLTEPYFSTDIIKQSYGQFLFLAF